MAKIDLNCDMGESFGAYTIGADEAAAPYITSANVACGFHAGDPMVMERTVALLKSHGVAIGAHPGFPDLRAAQSCRKPERSKSICAIPNRRITSILQGKRINFTAC